MSPLHRRIRHLAWIALVLGVATIVAGELAGWGWARLVSAALVSAGGVTLGSLTGFRKPGRRRLQDWLRRRGMLLTWALAAGICLPAVVALVAVIAGAVSAPGDSRMTALALGGVAVALAFLAATLMVTLIALRSIHDAARATPSSVPSPETETEGERT
jgi:lysylphosphatidylglycerol synthetase-like protein (DUF2156 family)